MKHYEKRKSGESRGKGIDRGWIVKFCYATWVVSTGTLACSQTPPATIDSTTPAANKNAAASGPGVGDTEGEKGDSDAAHSEQPATSNNDSQESTKKNSSSERPTLALTDIVKTLPKSFACGEHTCYRFDDSRRALIPVILKHKAQLIAFGEAHAPASFQGKTTVHRFTHDLLPTISDGASHLLLELLNPPKEGCQKEKKAAQAESKKITKGQAQSNQNEYMTLGSQARSLGIVPDILWATCDDLAFIASPEGGVVAMMETIAQLSEKSLKEQMRSTKKGRPLVLAYGGALHNDATPRETRASWSYGPTMIKDTKGSYLEIDLIIPELIGETDSWKSFAWYDAYQATDHKEGAVLMQWGDRSYSLFLEPKR